MNGILLIVGTDDFDQTVFIKLFSGKHRLVFVDDFDTVDQAFENVIPDVIIYEMKEIDKSLLKQAEAIRKQNGHSIPLILIANENTLEFEKAVRECGVSYYLLKPYYFRELNEAIESCIKMSKRLKVKNGIHEGGINAE